MKKQFLSLALMAAVLALAWRSYPQQKDPGGCDVPRSWGRLVTMFVEGPSWMLAFEADDGTVRFVTWNRCELRAVAHRTDAQDPKRR